MQEILKRLEDKVDQVGQRFDQVGQQFDQVGQRFDQMDQRFDQMDQRFDQMDQRFAQVDLRFEQVDQRLAQVDQRLAQGDQRLDGIDAQLHRQGVLLEAMNSDLKQTMETVTGNRQVLDQKFAEVLEKLDERVQPVELASRHFARELSAAREGKRPRRKTRA